MGRLKQYLHQRTKIPLIDSRSALIRDKNHYAIYQQTDTHWNNYGALIAFLSPVGRLRQDFPTIPNLCLSNYQIQSEQGVGGDLTTVLALNRKMTDPVDYRIKAILSLPASETERIENSFGKLPDQRFTSPNSGGPSLFLVSDSYAYSMNQLVPGYFSKTLVVLGNRLDITQVKQEKPAILAIEIAERDMALLADL